MKGVTTNRELSYMAARRPKVTKTSAGSANRQAANKGRAAAKVVDPPNGRKKGLPYTPRELDAFFDELKRSANITQSCASTTVDRCWVYLQRAKDAKFEERLQAAMKLGLEACEDEARRRAFKGDEATRYDKDGNVIQTYRMYSDRLAELMLKAHAPEKYRERISTENINLNVTELADEARERIRAKLLGR